MDRVAYCLGVWATIALGLCASSAGEDWPGWLGPRRDSVWRETGLLESFPDQGPRVRWRQPIQAGFAGPAVAAGRVIVTDFAAEHLPPPVASRRDRVDGVERVLCFSAGDGRLIWSHEEPRSYDLSYPAGPRAAPAIEGDHVYTFGAMGHLLCLRLADGTVVWSHDLPRRYGYETPPWGCAGHPLIDGRQLICLAGGAGSVVVSFDRYTGEELWRALSAKEPGYSSPAIIQAGGVPQLIVWHPESVNSLDPQTGKLYWSQPLEADWGMSIVTPRSDGTYLFVGAIIMKSLTLRLAPDRPAAEVVWRGEKGVGIAPTTSTPFLEDGYLYGVDREGELRCVELATGRQLWTTYAATTSGRRTDNATAFLVKQESRFLIFNERGELIIAHLSPAGYQEASRARILEPVGTSQGRPIVWSHPAYAGRCIFARNDRELVCVSLAAP